MYQYCTWQVNYDVQIVLGQDAITSTIREIHCRRPSTQSLGIVGRLQNLVEARWRRRPVSRMECQPTAPVRRFSDAANHFRISVRLVTLAKGSILTLVL